jgi:hypothetical protein
VALIVAGVGLSQNIINQNVFGVSIMMTLVTTILAPILLVPAFQRSGDGRKRADAEGDKLPPDGAHRQIELAVPADMAELVLKRLLKAAEQRGWEPTYERAAEDIYLLRCGDDAAQVLRSDGRIVIDVAAPCADQFVAVAQQVRESIVRDVASQPGHDRARG